MVPSTTHLTMRAATSAGLEKKNGGSTSVPKIGTVVRTCHSAIATTATRTCRASSVSRDTSSAPRLRVALEHLVLEPVPDLAMQVVEGAVELDLSDVARAGQRHA